MVEALCLWVWGQAFVVFFVVSVGPLVTPLIAPAMLPLSVGALVLTVTLHARRTSSEVRSARYVSAMIAGSLMVSGIQLRGWHVDLDALSETRYLLGAVSLGFPIALALSELVRVAFGTRSTRVRLAVFAVGAAILPSVVWLRVANGSSDPFGLAVLALPACSYASAVSLVVGIAFATVEIAGRLVAQRVLGAQE